MEIKNLHREPALMNSIHPSLAEPSPAAPGLAPPALPIAAMLETARLEATADLSTSAADCPAASTPEDLAPPTAVRMLLSKEIFGASREVCIAHRGALYRLRITMQNRLILQK
ncbi:MAG: hypothetical protein C0483_05020 [Pirellula sp.]|nr:hypothetical protein [Pirellula sp.]